VVLADLLSTVLTADTPRDVDPTAIEYTISLGNLLTIACFLVSATIYVVTSRNAAKVLGTRLENVDATMEDFKMELRKLGEILISQAKQEGRMNLLEQRIMQEGQRLDVLAENVGTFKNIVLKNAIT
jgi:hypothetical protein